MLERSDSLTAENKSQKKATAHQSEISIVKLGSLPPCQTPEGEVSYFRIENQVLFSAHV